MARPPQHEIKQLLQTRQHLLRVLLSVRFKDQADRQRDHAPDSKRCASLPATGRVIILSARADTRASPGIPAEADQHCWVAYCIGGSIVMSRGYVYCTFHTGSSSWSALARISYA